MNTRIGTLIAAVIVLTMASGCRCNMRNPFFGRGARCGLCKPKLGNPLAPAPAPQPYPVQPCAPQPCVPQPCVPQPCTPVAPYAAPAQVPYTAPAAPYQGVVSAPGGCGCGHGSPVVSAPVMNGHGCGNATYGSAYCGSCNGGAYVDPYLSGVNGGQVISDQVIGTSPTYPGQMTDQFQARRFDTDGSRIVWEGTPVEN